MARHVQHAGLWNLLLDLLEPLPESVFDSLAGVGKRVCGRPCLQLSQLGAEVWWEQVWPSGCPLAPLDEGRSCPLQSPHYQVQPALPLQAQPHCKWCCQAGWGEQHDQVQGPAGDTQQAIRQPIGAHGGGGAVCTWNGEAGAELHPCSAKSTGCGNSHPQV